MAWLVELLIYVFARPILEVILAVLGYDLDWDRRDGRRLRGWRLVISALFCCAVSGIVLGGLVWLIVLVYQWWG